MYRADLGVYDLLAELAPHAHRYLGIGVQEGRCVERVVGANPNLEQVVLCDTWGSTHGGTNRGSHEHVEQLLAGHRLGSRLRFLDGRSQDLIPALKEKFDLIFVDGDHTEDGALLDMANAWKKLEWSGAMVIHDIWMKTVHAAFYSFVVAARPSGIFLSYATSGTAVLYK